MNVTSRLATNSCRKVPNKPKFPVDFRRINTGYNQDTLRSSFRMLTLGRSRRSALLFKELRISTPLDPYPIDPNLERIPGVMPSAAGGWLVRFLYRSLEQPTLGTFVIAHGLNEHQGRYKHIAQKLVHLGWNVLTYDQIGHGVSSGARGHITRYETYELDLEIAVQEAQRFAPNLPIYLLGHSNGALMTFRYIREPKESSSVKGAIMVGIPFYPLVRTNAVESLAARVLPLVFPRMPLPNKLSAKLLCGNSSVVRKYLEDPKISRFISAKWYQQFTLAIEGALATKPKAILTPALLIHGGADRIVDVRGAKGAYERLGGARKLLIYPNLYHEVLNEKIYPEVMASIHKWATDLL